MILYIIVPCYNEEEVFPWSLDKLLTLTRRLKAETDTDARLLFVDDGSRDRTWQLISEAAEANKEVAGLKLAHNVGHQNALWADTWFKRVTAQTFYRIMQTADKNILYNHADFRMMSKRAVEALMQYPERNMFLRGIVRQLGFKEGFVYYDRTARTAGESKYPLGKMISFSIDGITSFSTAPLKFITFAGLAMTLVAVFIIVYALYEHAIGRTIEGWTSILVSMWLIGGVITTGVGITGVYIGKIYTEVKRRPRYFVDKKLNF